MNQKEILQAVSGQCEDLEGKLHSQEVQVGAALLRLCAVWGRLCAAEACECAMRVQEARPSRLLNTSQLNQ